jgi:endogenous inhibitor of DNA gyrase (YacG/DUF329 family)
MSAQRCCKQCAVQFVPDTRGGRARRDAQVYCSRVCYIAARWGAPIGERPCETCGTMMSPKNRRRRFCSFACRCAAIEGVPNPSRQRRVSVQCTSCKATIERRKSMVRGRPFCSPACRSKWQRETVRGQAHPRWLGGAPPSGYRGGWSSARRKAIARASGVCERCYAAPVEHVHHIAPIRLFADHTSANRLDNLLAVCRPCHTAIHRATVGVAKPEAHEALGPLFGGT